MILTSYMQATNVKGPADFYWESFSNNFICRQILHSIWIDQNQNKVLAWKKMGRSDIVFWFTDWTAGYTTGLGTDVTVMFYTPSTFRNSLFSFITSSCEWRWKLRTFQNWGCDLYVFEEGGDWRDDLQDQETTWCETLAVASLMKNLDYLWNDISKSGFIWTVNCPHELWPYTL